MSSPSRSKLKWVLWFFTWIGLLLGLVDRRAWVLVLLFSVAHAILFLVLHRFNLNAFPVQVRVGYVLWVAIGTYVPYMTILMYITTVGLVCNLFFSYCPLARMFTLLPWNRDERLSSNLLLRTFATPPVDGRFKPTPRAS